MKEILYLIFLPAFAGVLAYFVNRLRNELNFIGFFLTLFFSVELFIVTRTRIIAYSMCIIPGISFRFYLDSLSGLILLFNSTVAILIWFYSLRAMSKMPRERVYYLYVAITLSMANAIVVSGNFLMVIPALIVLTFLIYRLLLISKKDSSRAARRAIATIGLAILLILSGIGLLLIKHGLALNLPFEPRLGFDNALSVTSFILMSIGALIQAGAVPSQIWTAEAATVVPASTMAFIPASLNNLLGIYLLIRICYFVFNLSNSIPLRLILMTIGSATILVAVIKAVTQNEAMRLLSFHTVSQVGFMILGIGTGTPVGVAGGLFHMINNVICKTGLFFATGSVEFRTKTTQLGDLSGIRTKMPFTALSFVIAALAISDIPPLNCFYSKWMLYQGVIELSRKTILWPIFLLAMISGSILALISLMKMVYLLFLKKRLRKSNRVCETRFEMVMTTLILAFVCVVFGIFVNQVPLSKLIYPSLPFAFQKFGFGSSTLATLLVMAGFFVGLVILIFGKIVKQQSSQASMNTIISDEKGKINDLGE